MLRSQTVLHNNHTRFTVVLQEIEENLGSIEFLTCFV